MQTSLPVAERPRRPEWMKVCAPSRDGRYFDEGVRIIKTIGPEELRELARKYLKPEDFFELVVV